jgi:hypothetical protein
MRRFHCAFRFGEILDPGVTRLEFKIFEYFKPRQLQQSSALARLNQFNT